MIHRVLCTLSLSSFLFLSTAIAQNTIMDSASYSIGVLFANSLEQQGITEVDAEMIAAGLNDALAGNPKVTPQQAQEQFQRFAQAKQAAKFEANKEAGEAFLAKNKAREGVKTTDSGLQYEVLQAGDGASPSATDKVKVHYHGTLIDGTVFDSSVERGEPISFGLNQVIPGWTEGVQLMKVGAKYRFYIPSELAYGARGAGQDIKPFSALIFDVELLGIE